MTPDERLAETWPCSDRGPRKDWCRPDSPCDNCTNRARAEALLGEILEQLHESAAKLAAAQREIAQIDAAIARRPALDLPTRAENVARACSENQRLTDSLAAVIDYAACWCDERLIDDGPITHARAALRRGRDGTLATSTDRGVESLVAYARKHSAQGKGEK